MKFLFNILRIQIFIGLLLIPIISFTQEYTLKETPEQKQRKKELQEEQDNFNFQNFFFDALQQKSRNDYNKAVEILERCKNIYPDDDGMNFEFAKNYLLLKDYDNAIYFDEKVLEKKPKNIHVLEHLKKNVSFTTRL
jgi:tetratricopeptide (TPR) repeat protein